jgi:hypothetical protein
MIVAGRIAADGTVTLGSGFTCALDTNSYTITFQHKLKSILAVTATSHNTDCVICIETAAAVSAGVGTVVLTSVNIDETAALVDSIFDFVAVVVLA